MFKRVRSLILAGAIVLGMTVPAFATPTSYEDASAREKMIIDNYMQHMKDNGLGESKEITGIGYLKYQRKLNDDTGIKVNKNDLEVFVNSINASTTDYLYASLSDYPYNGNDVLVNIWYDENNDNKTSGSNEFIIEEIFIKYEEYNAAKGWIPQITPQTGQTLAIGGLVVGAAAGIGLLVNNKKRKDEE